MEKHDIEVEGGELLLMSKEGHYAIIPAKHRLEVIDMIKSGCKDCLNAYIKTLPREKNYADDGTVIPNSSTNTANSPDGPDGPDKPVKYYTKVLQLPQDVIDERHKDFKIVVTNDPNIKREPKTIYYDYDSSKELSDKSIVNNTLYLLGMQNPDVIKQRLRYDYYGEKYVEPMLEKKESLKTYYEALNGKHFDERQLLYNQNVQSPNALDEYISRQNIEKQPNADPEELKRFYEARDALMSYYGFSVIGTKDKPLEIGKRSLTIMKMPLNNKVTSRVAGTNEPLVDYDYQYVYDKDSDDYYISIKPTIREEYRKRKKSPLENNNYITNPEMDSNEEKVVRDFYMNAAKIRNAKTYEERKQLFKNLNNQ